MWGSAGAMETQTAKVPNIDTHLRSGVVGVTECGFVSFTSLKDLDLVHKRFAKKMEKNFKKMRVILPDECISGIYEESGLPNDIVHLL